MNGSLLGGGLLLGGVIVGVLAVAAFVLVLVNQERPRVAPVAVKVLSCTGGAFLAGVVASWVGVMLLV